MNQWEQAAVPQRA